MIDNKEIKVRIDNITLTLIGFDLYRDNNLFPLKKCVRNGAFGWYYFGKKFISKSRIEKIK